MSSELATQGSVLDLESLGITTELATEDADLTKTSDFLPQFRVFGSESKIVKQGKFPMGHFGLYMSADSILDLGEECNILPIAPRPRASIVTGDQPVSFYDKDSAEFDQIKLLALDKVDGHLFGFEYLIWLPDQERFCMFFMGNPTLRRESGNVHGRLGKASMLKIKLINGKKYTWHGAEIAEALTDFVLPTREQLQTEVAKFKNPKGSALKMASDQEADTRAR